MKETSRKKLNNIKNKSKTITKLVVRQFSDPYYQGVAAQLAFFMFLSIIPLLIIISQVLGVFELTAEGIESWANITVEDTILTQLLETKPSGVNTFLLIVITVWAASRMQFNLIKATNYTLTDGAYIGKGFMRERARAMFSTLLTLIAIVISLVVMVYGRNVVLFIIDELGNPFDISSFVNGLLVWLSWPIAFGVFFLLVLFAFHNLPSERFSVKELLPGSVLTSVGLLLLTGAYSTYTKYIVNFNILYGTFSSLIAMMFFFWLSAWILLVGIVFNRVWWATREVNPIPLSKDVTDRQHPMKILW